MSNTAQVKMIRDTFNAIEDTNAFATDFYDNIFAEYPELQPMFANTSLEILRAMIMKSLIVIVNEHLTNHSTNVKSNGN